MRATDTPAIAPTPAEWPQRTHVVVTVLFFAVVVIAGGSSRYDAVQLLLLQPLAWLTCGYAACFVERTHLRRIAVPLALLLVYFVWTLIQLVPLPYEVWTALPGREALTGVAEALGDTAPRPIAMVPERTVHALANLGVPLAGLVTFAVLRSKGPEITLGCLIVFGLAGAMLGIMQVLGGQDSPLYYYQLTNRGAFVGFFANSNHAAAANSVLLVVLALSIRLWGMARGAIVRIVLPFGFLLILLAQLINGSRAGLVTSALAIAAAAAILLVGHKDAATAVRDKSHRIVAGALALAAIAVFAAFLFAERIPALAQITSDLPLADRRFLIIGTLGEMARAYFLTGIGPGGFEKVFRIYETPDLLLPDYLNQAHNDLLQWVIEGGLPASILLLGFAAWFAWAVVRLARRGEVPSAAAAVAIAVVLVAASLVDYPLRTPLMQFMAAWLVANLCHAATSGSDPTPAGHRPFHSLRASLSERPRRESIDE